ncbi:hypothetical protein ACEPPN_017965 [Leptodophora sp. 'Broadleaf-Isolate-01']
MAESDPKLNHPEFRTQADEPYRIITFDASAFAITNPAVHNLEGEKSAAINHYIPRNRFKPIPVSDQEASEFLARTLLLDKVKKHLRSRRRGDARRRVQDISLSDAMVNEQGGQ